MLTFADLQFVCIMSLRKCVTLEKKLMKTCSCTLFIKNALALVIKVKF